MGKGSSRLKGVFGKQRRVSVSMPSLMRTIQRERFLALDRKEGRKNRQEGGKEAGKEGQSKEKEQTEKGMKRRRTDRREAKRQERKKVRWMKVEEGTDRRDGGMEE